MDFSISWIYFSKRRCLKFNFYPVSIACLQLEIDRGKIQLLHLKANLPLFCTVKGAYFYMDAYKCNVVAVIKMGAYIHGMLILCGCILPDFTVFDLP